MGPQSCGCPFPPLGLLRGSELPSRRSRGQCRVFTLSPWLGPRRHTAAGTGGVPAAQQGVGAAAEAALVPPVGAGALPGSEAQPRPVCGHCPGCPSTGRRCAEAAATVCCGEWAQLASCFIECFVQTYQLLSNTSLFWSSGKNRSMLTTESCAHDPVTPIAGAQSAPLEDRSILRPVSVLPRAGGRSLGRPAAPLPGPLRGGRAQAARPGTGSAQGGYTPECETLRSPQVLALRCASV